MAPPHSEPEYERSAPNSGGVPLSPGDPKPGDHIGAYVVVRLVARGGMAVVLEVRDPRDPSAPHVGMKLLLPLSHAEEARTRFRREFRALSKLQHPNVLRVFEWGLYHERPWYTMELVEGRVLRDEVNVWAKLPPNDRFLRAASVLVQVARALAYIHDRGLVHRDITPGNIMVRPDGIVKLMDFGVVKDLGTELTLVGEVVGTVAYISPEQIAGDAIDARADLYSLGAVLYLMLTGRRPFAANTLQGYLDKHLHEAPKPPHEIDPAVPPNLDAICVRLLAKAPGDRYASATHLLHVLDDIAWMEDGEGRWPPRAVGRGMLRARLREALDDVAAGRPGAAVQIIGASGTGKTRLIDAVDQYGRRLGLKVARGKCQDADRPFGAFQAVYRELKPDVAVPLLAAAFEDADDGIVRERYPVIAAFRDLVVQRAPCVIILDDLDRADPATAELLQYLVRNTLGLAKSPVLYVLAEESDATDTALSRALAEAGPVEKHALGPLEPSEVEELVLSILPDSPASAALARRLHAEGNGSPAFIADMLRALVDEGILRRDGNKFALEVDEAELTRSKLPMPASMRGALLDRIAPLRPDAVEIGRTLAIARRKLDLDALCAAAKFDEDRVMAALDELIDAEIVTETRDGETEHVELSHHRLRDVLLEPLAAEDRRARHQQMGEILERTHRHRPQIVVEELAWHFEQAGLAPKAYAYLALTASRNLHRSLYDEALGYLDRALAMEATARPLMLLDDADRRLAEVYLERSQALYHLGDWNHAIDDIHRAEPIAAQVRDPRLQSRIAGELGNQLRNRGHLREAERALTTALAKAQEAGDATLRPTPLYALGGLAWGNGDLEGAEKLWKESLATAQRVGDERAMGMGYNGLGIYALCKGDATEARRHLEQSAEIFERLGVLGSLAIARVNLVEVYLATGLLKKALALADRTVEQAKEVHHPHGIALGLAYRAHVLAELGREDEATTSARDALRLVRQLGTPEDEIVALTALIRVDLDRGQPSAALDWVGHLVPLIEEHDNEGIAGLVFALRAQALAQLGRPEEARAALTGNDGAHWPLVQVRTDLARGIAWRRLDEPASARETLQRALAQAEAAGFRLYQLVAHHELWRVTDDDAARARHARVAGALAKSLAANLVKEDAQRFLAMGWGGTAAVRTPSAAPEP